MGINQDNFWRIYFCFVVIFFFIVLSYMYYYVTNLKNCLCREVDRMIWSYIITGSHDDCVVVCEGAGLIPQYEAGNLSDII